MKANGYYIAIEPYRIEQSGFEEGIDYITLHKTVEREIGATTRTEYHISTDMANHIELNAPEFSGTQSYEIKSA